MDLTSVDEARTEVRRLGAALTAYELANPAGATVPAALLRELAAASRHLIVAISECIVRSEPGAAHPGDVRRRPLVA